jgi:hypothetical protein
MRAATEFFDWLAAKGLTLARRDREHSRCNLQRGIVPRSIRADREAAPRRAAPLVRLDGDRPDHADQSGRRRARAAPHRAARQDAGARSGRGPAAHRCHRRDDDHRLARLRVDWPHGLFLRAHRRGARHARRGRAHEERPSMGSPEREGGKQHAMPCHHNLESYLHTYNDGAGLANDPNALLFQTYSHATGQLTGNPRPKQTPTR